jgi:PII-like signaling protein
MDVNEETRSRSGPLYEAVLVFLLHKGVAGATASRAIAGFGTHQLLSSTTMEELTQHLPVRIEFVETAEKVDEVLPALYDIVTDGLIEVQDTFVVKATAKEKHAETRQPHEVNPGKARLMRIYIGEADMWKGEPLYDAIVKRLRLLDISGATVHRGIAGYGAKGVTHKQSFWHLSRDLPIMIAVVDTEEKLDAAIDTIKPMIQDGLIVFSDVEIIRLVHSQSLGEASDANRTTG